MAYPVSSWQLRILWCPTKRPGKFKEYTQNQTRGETTFQSSLFLSLLVLMLVFSFVCQRVMPPPPPSLHHVCICVNTRQGLWFTSVNRIICVLSFSGVLFALEKKEDEENEQEPYMQIGNTGNSGVHQENNECQRRQQISIKNKNKKKARDCSNICKSTRKEHYEKLGGKCWGRWRGWKN